MKQMIENAITGCVSMDVFIEELHTNHELQQCIRNFVPSDAKENPGHCFWKVVPYQSLRQNNFDYLEFLFWALNSKEKYSLHLNVFTRLRKAYCYYNPNVQCTCRYDEAFDLYLDAIKDCFDGPEVRSLVEQIISDSMQLPSKAKRIKHAQMMVSTIFHVKKNKRPRWVQGPEWPMGVSSPMIFEAQKNNVESVSYHFRDSDTCDSRIVIQYY